MAHTIIRPEGTVEISRRYPLSLQDTFICGFGPDTPVWLISIVAPRPAQIMLTVPTMNSDGGIAIAVGYAVAAAFFALAYWIWRMETAARKWPRTSGVILASQCLKGPRYSVPVIEYEFAYDGRTFKSSHWRLGNYSTGAAGLGRSDAAAVARRYPVGRPVTVFVNPRDPTKSVLEASGSLFWLPSCAGIFIFGLSTVVIITLALQQR